LTRVNGIRQHRPIEDLRNKEGGLQSVCALLPLDHAERIVGLRSSLCEDPAVGAISDPPFVHFTLQLAEEYDWHGLASALAGFAKECPPFELTTVGLLAFTGTGTTIAVAPRKDHRLTAFHAAVWEMISPYAQGRVDPFYHPDRWVPHITIKRIGPHADSFGGAMAKLAAESFSQTMTIDTVAVQHDPGKNSLTHYVRLRFPLAGSASATGSDPRAAHPVAPTNATIRELRTLQVADGSTVWSVVIQPDTGPELTQEWNAPSVVRLMAGAESSTAHFVGARCQVEGDAKVTAIRPNTPFPVP
jgi:2'-5' RNA ligase